MHWETSHVFLIFRNSLNFLFHKGFDRIHPITWGVISFCTEEEWGLWVLYHLFNSYYTLSSVLGSLLLEWVPQIDVCLGDCPYHVDKGWRACAQRGAIKVGGAMAVGELLCFPGLPPWPTLPRKHLLSQEEMPYPQPGGQWRAECLRAVEMSTESQVWA